MFFTGRQKIYLTGVTLASALGMVANLSLADDEKPHFPTVESIVQQSDLASKENFDCGEGKASIKVKHGPIAIKLSNGTTAALPDPIIITYSGSNCSDCVWIQFIWRKVIVTLKDATTSVDKTLSGKAVVPYLDPKTGKEISAKYDLTSDEISDPKWTTDSPKYGKDPTFSAKKGCLQASDCPTANIVADTPSPLFGYYKSTSELASSYELDAASEKFLSQATMVRALFHADTYLVCKGKVCAKVSWNAKWSYEVNKGKVDKNKFSVIPEYYDVSIDAGAKPTTAQIAVLNQDFPGQTALP
jgi:hypothetical protein